MVHSNMKEELSKIEFEYAVDDDSRGWTMNLGNTNPTLLDSLSVYSLEEKSCPASKDTIGNNSAWHHQQGIPFEFEMSSDDPLAMVYL